jgi:hypothetical protein
MLTICEKDAGVTSKLAKRTEYFIMVGDFIEIIPKYGLQCRLVGWQAT